MGKKTILVTLKNWQSTTNLEHVFLKALKKAFPKRKIKQKFWPGEWGFGNGHQILLKKKKGEWESFGFIEDYIEELAKIKEIMKNENVTVNFPLKISRKKDNGYPYE